MEVKALIADDLAIIRNLIVQVLEGNFENVIVKEAKDGKDLLISAWVGFSVYSREMMLSPLF